MLRVQGEKKSDFQFNYTEISGNTPFNGRIKINRIRRIIIYCMRAIDYWLINRVKERKT